jgi:hypothetical protein
LIAHTWPRRAPAENAVEEVQLPILPFGARRRDRRLHKLGASTLVSSCARPPRNRRDGVAALAPLDAATQRGAASMLFAESA